MTPPASIAVVGTNSPQDYSGGRYHALMMAEALALAGYEVSYVTNHRPIFYDDLSALPRHAQIKLLLSSDFAENMPQGTVDIVMVVPSLARSPEFYRRCLNFARRKRARLGLLNFEDGAWFNSLSSEPRDIRLWDNWITISRFASLILSSAKESRRHAVRFYRHAPKTAVFAHAHPSINDLVADGITGIPREDRILTMSRFGNARHKGGHRLAELIGPAMRGYTFVLLVGAGGVPAATLAELEGRAAEVGARIELKSKLSDAEKFRELKRAKLLLFPSMFEGFGYPPVEAQYCNTPCVAFDLPVLREHSDEGLHYVERGNWQAFKAKVEEILAVPFVEQDLNSRVKSIATCESFAERMDAVIKETMQRRRPSGYALSAYCAYTSCRSLLHRPRRVAKRILTRMTDIVSR